jgi:hypothetical protein
MMYTLKRSGLPLYRAVMTVVLVLTLAAGAVACARPSPPVGLSDCYQSLPLAEGALNAPRGSYAFHGVKLVQPRLLERLVRQHSHSNPPMPSIARRTSVCAFAFTGNFPAGQVAGAQGKAAGKAAIVLVTTQHKLLFSFVLSKLPERFSRPFTGA